MGVADEARWAKSKAAFLSGTSLEVLEAVELLEVSQGLVSSRAGLMGGEAWPEELMGGEKADFSLMPGPRVPWGAPGKWARSGWPRCPR